MPACAKALKRGCFQVTKPRVVFEPENPKQPDTSAWRWKQLNAQGETLAFSGGHPSKEHAVAMVIERKQQWADTVIEDA